MLLELTLKIKDRKTSKLRTLSPSDEIIVLVLDTVNE